METAFAALSRLRGETAGERSRYFYVTDSDERLVGVVPSRRLLLADPAILIAELMMYPVVSVLETQTFGSALALLAQHRLLALPVIDDGGRLTGVLDVTGMTGTLFKLERAETVDQIYQLAGVRPERQKEGRFWRAFAERYSVLVSVAAGILAAYLLSVAGNVRTGPGAVAIFIPLMMAFGCSIALQTITGSLQRLHCVRQRESQVFREIAMGVAWSGGAALIAGLWVAGWTASPRLALVVACSLFTAGANGAVLGCWTPHFIRSMDLQRAIASGPAALAMTTVASLAGYLALWAAVIS
jgi:magnesium transporter